jgi:hypothetical protein
MCHEKENHYTDPFPFLVLHGQPIHISSLCKEALEEPEIPGKQLYELCIDLHYFCMLFHFMQSTLHFPE